ncbi:restriction endonuclease subunit S [Microbulbifer sp. DLAB2-AA]|uniref:restriction endonuclease subunit S n=1 Tax=Microbulbifer sp. DLAB2-AA TaxID=3243394 RepID=UPI0040394C60
MSYARYENYSDSRLQWLGEIPSHWKVVQSRRLFEQRKERMREGDEQLTASQKYGIISQKKFMELENQRVVQVLTGSEILKHIEPNDFVISMRSFQGGLEWCKQSGCVSSAYIGLIPIKHVVPEFFAYLFKCRQYIQALQSTSNLVRDGQALRFENFSQIWLPIIPNDEQKKIANFLDHETAKIDTLIEKQQQLIQLLKEKRQAVISHAVTKGLNPDAPMRDSGVEWLGEVPEHWVVKRLKHISPKVGVGLVINPSTYTRDEGVYFIFGGDVKEYYFDLSNTRRMSQQDSDNLLSSRLNHRDIISIRVGYPGVSAVVPAELEGSNCASVIITRRGAYNSDWLCAAMNTWVGRQQVDLVSYGAAQKQFNVADAVEFVFPVPPDKEQKEIAEFVQDSLNRFNTLSIKAERQIELLQERRTALISAAVTGKIDVRNWQAPKAADREAAA